jgi:hypothetical protein
MQVQVSHISTDDGPPQILSYHASRILPALDGSTMLHLHDNRHTNKRLFCHCLFPTSSWSLL